VITLYLPDGPNDDGEPMCRPLSRAEYSAVKRLLRDFPNRMRIPAARAANVPLGLFKAAMAGRIQFEAACDLVEQPPEQSLSALSEHPRVVAVGKALAAGMNPPSTISWTAFCGHIRDDADGWIDKKEGTKKRGFDDRTIKRDVKKLRSLN
jgi:hypothetical protein